jgi:hypothetical protein
MQKIWRQEYFQDHLKKTIWSIHLEHSQEILIKNHYVTILPINMIRLNIQMKFWELDISVSGNEEFCNIFIV